MNSKVGNHYYTYWWCAFVSNTRKRKYKMEWDLVSNKRQGPEEYLVWKTLSHMLETFIQMYWFPILCLVQLPFCFQFDCCSIESNTGLYALVIQNNIGVHWAIPDHVPRSCCQDNKIPDDDFFFTYKCPMSLRQVSLILCIWVNVIQCQTYNNSCRYTEFDNVSLFILFLFMERTISNARYSNYLRNECLFFLGSWGMNRSAGQTNRVNREAVLERFVCSALRFIPNEPRKKTLIPYIYNAFNKDPF